MLSQKINVTALKDSIRTIIFDGYYLMCEDFKHLDFEKIVGTSLKKCGYVYNIDPVSGDFTITVVSGYYIRAKWKGDLYEINIEISQSGLLANTKGIYWDGYRYDPDYQPLIAISPFAIENYKPLFDKLAEGLRREYMKYEIATKGDMNSQLLKSIMAPSLKSHNLRDVKVEKCDEDQEQFRIIKKVCANVYFSSTAKFYDFENSIANIAKAVDAVPSWIKKSKGLYITFADHFFNITYNGIRCTGAPDTLEESRMYYGNSLFSDSLTEDFSPSVITKQLEKRKFKFYVTDYQYNIFLNDELLLCRNQNNVWIQQVSGEIILKPDSPINDSEFERLLDIITWGCTKEGYVISSTKYFHHILEASIEMSLPNTVRGTLFDRGIGLYYKKTFYNIDVKAEGWITLLCTLIKAMRSDENIIEFLYNSDVETLIKERMQGITYLKRK
ncbi:MAG: hypothetical protein HDS78_03305 [Bacteroidales bacterium]|nr:hypothetical protein [Bacteroidales bacterium]